MRRHPLIAGTVHEGERELGTDERDVGPSRRRYSTAPMWSSWPWVSTTATTSSSPVHHKGEVGQDQSTPG